MNETKETPKPWWKRTKLLARVFRLDTIPHGQPVKFSDGSIYRQTTSGNLVKLSPLKPYRNKREQKAYLKQRRQERLEAA